MRYWQGYDGLLFLRETFGLNEAPPVGTSRMPRQQHEISGERIKSGPNQLSLSILRGGTSGPDSAGSPISLDPTETQNNRDLRE